MSELTKKRPANCIDQEADDNHMINDPPSPILQSLMQKSDAFLYALKQSEKWPDIEPELRTAVTTIDEGIVVKGFDTCLKLENRVSPEDLFNIHGFLVSRMAIQSLALIHDELPAEALRVDVLVYHAMMTGAAFHQLDGSVPVKELVAEWAPCIDRDKVRQEGCSTGGTHAGESRADEAGDRHCNVITEAKKLLNVDHSNRKWVVRTLSQRPLKSDSEPYSKRHIERILKKAGI